MPVLPPVHLAIMQPAGYLHSQGFLDQARYLRWQLRRFGTEVTLAKNRLREDAVNIVFGAHLGFPPELRERHACIFMNLEQLGHGGAAVDPDYLRLLRGSAVADYDARNVASYCDDAADVPLLPFLHAPYLRHDDALLPLAQRPIDLLFFGSMNERRRRFIERVEATGASVAVFDHPVYGPERDAFIRQAKAVLNCHFYDSSRFEQARTALCLSLGTPVVSERTAATVVDPAFEDCVSWVDEAGLEDFFCNVFATPAWFETAQRQLDAWTHTDDVNAYADLMAFAAGFFEGHCRHRPAAPWQPSRLQCGGDYRPGWLNVDADEALAPDLALDLGRALALPLHRPTRLGGEVVLAPTQLACLRVAALPAAGPARTALLDNALALLAEGGDFELDTPASRAAADGCWWQECTSDFWRLGWTEHRFVLSELTWLDERGQPGTRERAARLRVLLRKVAVTPHERTVVRALRHDFGDLDDDLVPGTALAA